MCGQCRFDAQAVGLSCLGVYRLSELGLKHVVDVVLRVLSLMFRVVNHAALVCSNSRA